MARFLFILVIVCSTLHACRCDDSIDDPTECQSRNDRGQCVVDPLETDAGVPDTRTDGGACERGFLPPECETCDEENGFHADGMGGCTTDPCLPNPCSQLSRTVCTPEADSYRCGCDEGFHLAGDECVADETCGPDSCSGHGACDDGSGIAVCTCDEGYVGGRCDTCDSDAGFRPDGMGGCTDDPCTPNPCTEPDKSQCVTDGNGYLCECDPGFEPDGMGGCTDDPCTPNPCAAMNQACRVTNGMAECYTPVCDDQNPCTEDTLVGGECQFDPITCDDGNPCTDDSCDPASGCEYVDDDTNVPDDGLACTVGTCSNGFQSHTPDDGLCDDGLFCNGVETCAPSVPSADADGCLDGVDPFAPKNPGPCILYEACDEANDEFPLTTLAAGDDCNDGLYCTTGDVCDASGNCRGTATAICGTTPGSCATTEPLPDTIDIGEASLAVDVTVDGQPLPATSSDGAGYEIFAVARDTGVRHSIAYWYWDLGGDLVAPDVAERLVPGVYDILYRKGQSSQTDRVFRTDADDVAPNGVRILQRDVFLYAGPNDLDIDIPQTDLTVNVTVDGQPLPTTSSDGAGYELFAVAEDTGVRHSIAYWYWDLNGDLVPPEVAERLIPGTYDILYRKGQSTQTDRVFRTDADDVAPNGVRVLQQDVTIGPGATTLDIGIPQSAINVDVTVDGQPLPATSSDGAGYELFAVAEDTEVRHSIAYWYWDLNGDLVAPDVADRLIPGTYDILYRKGQSTQTDRVFRTDAADVAPNGVRVLEQDVAIGPGATNLAIDVPSGDLSVSVTVGGQPLPATSSDGAGYELFAVSQDTGVRHSIAYWYWDLNGDLVAPDTADRLIPGTYDILYQKGQSTQTDRVFRTDANDVAPNGVRILQADVAITDGTNNLTIDIPQTPLDVTVTADGQPLPATSSDGAGYELFAVARDTGVRHSIAYWYWDLNGDLVAPDTADRLLPGTYDILYRKGQSSQTDRVFRTDSDDVLPNGVRYLTTVDVSGAATQPITIDVPDSPVTFDVAVSGNPLPATSNDGAGYELFAVAKDTTVRHSIAYWYWDLNGDLVSPDYTERLVPGTYHILYRKGQSSQTDRVFRTDDDDVAPNGLRYLDVCIAIP